MSGQIPGMMANSMPGWIIVPGIDPGVTFWAQVRGWNSAFGSDWQAARDADPGLYAETDIRPIAGGPDTGPGVTVWQATSLSDPNRFHRLIFPVPEPSIMTFGALISVFLLLRFRRTLKPNRLMKKLLLTLGLIGITTLSHAQGTIAFGNSALTRIEICADGQNFRRATAADGITVGIWYGSSADSLQQAPGTASIGSVDRSW